MPTTEAASIEVGFGHRMSSPFEGSVYARSPDTSTDSFTFPTAETSPGASISPGDTFDHIVEPVLRKRLLFGADAHAA